MKPKWRLSHDCSVWPKYWSCGYDSRQQICCFCYHKRLNIFITNKKWTASFRISYGYYYYQRTFNICNTSTDCNLCNVSPSSIPGSWKQWLQQWVSSLHGVAGASERDPPCTLHSRASDTGLRRFQFPCWYAKWVLELKGGTIPKTLGGLFMAFVFASQFHVYLLTVG